MANPETKTVRVWARNGRDYVDTLYTLNEDGETYSQSVNAEVTATVDTSALEAKIGATTDVAVQGDNPGSLSAKSRGLNKLFSDIWDTVNHALKVNVVAGGSEGGGGAVTIADGDDVALGAKADAEASSSVAENSTPRTAISLLKGIKNILILIYNLLTAGIKTTDNGSAWVPYHFTFHGDAHTVQPICAAPTAGQKNVMREMLIISTAACEIRILEETSNTLIHGPYPLAANQPLALITRSTPMSKLPTADKRYMVIADAPGGATQITDHVTVETYVSNEP